MGPERYARFSFFCGDVVPRKKPQPDVYNLAAQEMGLDKSECVPIWATPCSPASSAAPPTLPPAFLFRCVVIEDSGIGNQAAKSAGMACLVTKSTYTEEEDFSGADRIVSELGEPGGGGECVTLADLRALL